MHAVRLAWRAAAAAAKLSDVGAEVGTVAGALVGAAGCATLGGAAGVMLSGIRQHRPTAVAGR